MVKIPNLSAIVIKMKAFSLGGASIYEVNELYQLWVMKAKINSNVCNRLQSWIDIIDDCIKKSIKSGAPIGLIFEKIYPIIYQEECLIKKIKSVEKQYAFQGAIIIVLPWFVCLLFNKFQLNPLYILGICLQIFGVLLMVYFFKKTLKSESSEINFLKILLSNLWLNVMVEGSLLSSIDIVINKVLPNNKNNYFELNNNWSKWFQNVYKGDQKYKNYFNEKFYRSKEVSEILEKALKLGAPAIELISEIYKHVEEESKVEFEENIMILPTMLSLLFCFVFAPACLFILVGVLWPQLIKII